MGNSKYYVVWKGLEPGVYDSWVECKKQVENFTGAAYKSFLTKEEAEEAFHSAKRSPFRQRVPSVLPPSAIEGNSLSVDAACSGNPGVMEYRGVHTSSGRELFKQKFPLGTNNIGEFLALVHGLSYMKKNKLPYCIYTDSVNAIKWVRDKKCKTKLERNAKTESLFQQIEKAERWLVDNYYTTPILKWDTQNWGEIPADFGRKS